MNATCLSIRYEGGRFSLVQGVKSYADNHTWPGGGFRNRGYGWGEIRQASKLILTVTVPGTDAETGLPGTVEETIWVDRAFKQGIGRLTEKRRAAIAATMPPTIRVEERVSRRGTRYYAANAEDLGTWVAATLTHLEPSRSPRGAA